MMKEKYISPELELLCLAPIENLANDTSEFDSLLGSQGGGVSADPNVDIDIPLN